MNYYNIHKNIWPVGKSKPLVIQFSWINLLSQAVCPDLPVEEEDYVNWILLLPHRQQAAEMWQTLAIFLLSISNIVSRLLVSLGTAAELIYTLPSLQSWYTVIILHTEYGFRMFAGLQTQTFPSPCYWHLLFISSSCTVCIWLHLQNKVHWLLFHIHYYFLRRQCWHLWCFRLTELIMFCQIWMKWCSQ